MWRIAHSCAVERADVSMIQVFAEKIHAFSVAEVFRLTIGIGNIVAAYDAEYSSPIYITDQLFDVPL